MMIRRNLLAAAGVLAAAPAFAQAPSPPAAPNFQASAAARAELAPTGTLRAAINYGNTVLVQRGPTADEPRGVSPALARALAARLGVPLTLVPFDAAGRVTEANRASGGVLTA